MAKQFNTQINTLLSSRSATNNTLAYLLLKSQRNYTPQQAWLEIYCFQHQFWQKDTKAYTFELNEYKFSATITEELSGYYDRVFYDYNLEVKVFKLSFCLYSKRKHIEQESFVTPSTFDSPSPNYTLIKLESYVRAYFLEAIESTTLLQDMKTPATHHIDQFLASNLTVNNNLAFELLKSQLNYSTREALKYVFDFQCQHFWKEDIAKWQFEVNDCQFSTHFYYDDADGRAYGFDHLYLFVQIPDSDYYQSKYLGTLAAKAKSPVLQQYETEAKTLFEKLLEELGIVE